MSEIRNLTDKENNLLRFLLSRLNTTDEYEIPEKVISMIDGGMGSITFDIKKSSSFGQDLIQAQYKDDDNVEVMITLTTDSNNKLFELDFWKVDFSSLIKYPEPSDLEIKSR